VGAKALGQASDSNHALHIECHHAKYNPHPGAIPLEPEGAGEPLEGAGEPLEGEGEDEGKSDFGEEL